MPLLDLQIERPVAGGRMLARHDGVVVLVAGAIPGERIRARVEKRTRTLIWAEAVEVLDPSPARRDPICDRACGGMDYGHITYADQLRFKSEVLLDAFRRIGKVSIDTTVEVVPSPELGYRLRARLHVRGGRAGFFREGTHELCDAARTGQLRPDTIAAVDATLASLGEAVREVDAVVVSENVAATERVLHFEGRDDRSGRPVEHPVATHLRIDSAIPVTGLTSGSGARLVTIAGSPYVTDTARDLFGDHVAALSQARWTRQAASFFQGNRFLAGALANEVIAHARGERIADLYAGVGLFAAAFAARGATVVAVEGDPISGDDLEHNLEAWPTTTDVVRASVEQAVPRLRAGFDTIVVDPPRTGLSPEALSAVLHLQAPRVIYVSCDPATLARDAAKLVGAGHRIVHIRAFDLFPNTAHVESVVVFDRSTGQEA